MNWASYLEVAILRATKFCKIVGGLVDFQDPATEKKAAIPLSGFFAAIWEISYKFSAMFCEVYLVDQVVPRTTEVEYSWLICLW